MVSVEIFGVACQRFACCDRFAGVILVRATVYVLFDSSVSNHLLHPCCVCIRMCCAVMCCDALCVAVWSNPAWRGTLYLLLLSLSLSLSLSDNMLTGVARWGMRSVVCLCSVCCACTVHFLTHCVAVQYSQVPQEPPALLPERDPPMNWPQVCVLSVFVRM
jgi:hypothetical protein